MQGKNKPLKLAPGECCGNCRFLWALPYDASPDGSIPSGVNYFCRRFPPTLYNSGMSSAFPPTSPTKWCGEWQLGTKERKELKA